MFKSGNESLAFFMPDCAEKQEIIELVEKNGGKMGGKNDPACLYLLPYETNFMVKASFTHEVYSYKFVIDSVKLGMLQRLKDYELEKPAGVSKTTSFKIKYTEKDDQDMRKYVKENCGNPANISYWTTANARMGWNRTADSLRCHWKFINSAPKAQKVSKENPSVKYVQKLLKKKAENPSVVLKAEASILEPAPGLSQENVEFDMNIDHQLSMKNEDNEEDVKKRLALPVSNAYSKQKHNVDELTHNEIDDYFITLVEMCRLKSGISLVPSTVAEALVNFNGDVRETINFFRLHKE